MFLPLVGNVLILLGPFWKVLETGDLVVLSLLLL